MSLLPNWRTSGAPCDSCGKHDDNWTLTLVLVNAKAEMGYKLPDLTLCKRCRSNFRQDIYTGLPQ